MISRSLRRVQELAKLPGMDTEQRVTQLDNDVRAIYGLLRGVASDVAQIQTDTREQWGMLMRQGNRLNSLEANVARLAEGQDELRIQVGSLQGDVTEILRLLQPGD